MPFIGTQPDVGGYSVLDALTASATASYTLQKDSTNFAPSSANQLLVSLNGVIQKPGSSFTVSGSTLTFSSALSSSDSIDFILVMGEPLLVGTPSDGTVNADKLATNAVSSAKIASSAVTTAKIANNAVTSGKMFSTFENGIEFFETYRLAANTSATSSNDFTQSFTLASNRSYGALVPGGTGMSYSSGIWTFPATGMYLVHMHFRCYRNGALDYMEVFGNVTSDNSSYNEAMNAMMGWGNHNSTTYQSCDNWCIFDVTDTSTHKMKFTWAGSHSVAFAGGNTNASNITFMRIGDT